MKTKRGNGMRVLFMGTPEYAVSVLKALRTLVADESIRVVSQPDRAQGRHRKIQPSVVSTYALAHGLALDRPQQLNRLKAEWTHFAPDLVLTAAYGRILPAWLLALPRRALNLHASLLPRWRGPNPIAWAIYAGDRETGISLMEMARGIDTGPVLEQQKMAVEAEDTLSTLSERLGALAGQVLVQAWNDILVKRAEIQIETLATYAPKFPPLMAKLDFTQPAALEARRIRSMTDSPGAYTTWNGLRIRVAPAELLPGVMAPGQIVPKGDAWQVGCGKDTLVLTRIQPEGKTWMTPAAFSRGLKTEHPVRLS